MKVKDLTEKLIAGMPIIINGNGNQCGTSYELCRVSCLTLNGKLMIPEPLLEMEVSMISLHEENEIMYLHIDVNL